MKTLKLRLSQKAFDENRGRFVWKNEVQKQSEVLSYTDVIKAPERKVVEDRFYRERMELAAEIEGIPEKIQDNFAPITFDGRLLSLQLAEKFGESPKNWGHQNQPKTFYILGVLQKMSGIRVDKISTLKGKTLVFESGKFVLKAKPKSAVSEDSKAIEANYQEKISGKEASESQKKISALQEKAQMIQPGNRIDSPKLLSDLEEAVNAEMEKNPEIVDDPAFQDVERTLLRAQNKKALLDSVFDELQDYSADWEDETFTEEDGRIMVDGKSFLGFGSRNKYLFDKEGTENDYEIPGNFRIDEALSILNDPANKEYLKSNGEVIPEVEKSQEKTPKSQENLNIEEVYTKSQEFLTSRKQALEKAQEFTRSGKDFEDILGGSIFPKALGYAPFLTEMAIDFEDTDLYGYEEEALLAKEAVEKTAENLLEIRGIRDSLEGILQKIPEKERTGDAYGALLERFEEIQKIYLQDSEDFLRISANIGNDFEENDDFINPEMTNEILSSYLESLPYDEAFAYVQESLERMDDNYFQTDKAKAVYGVFANTAQTALAQKLNEQQISNDPAFVQHSLDMALLFTDRSTDIPSHLENPEFAIDRLEEVLDMDFLAEKFSQKELPLRTKTKSLVEEVQGYDEYSYFHEDQKEILSIDLEKASLSELAQAFTVAKIMKAQKEQESYSIADIEQEALDGSLSFLRRERQKFLGFLDSGSGSSLEEVSAKTGVSFSDEQGRAFALLNDIAGYGSLNLSDETWGGIREGTKIVGVIAVAVAVGIATAGMGTLATAAIAGGTMTVANAAIMDKGYSSAGELGMDLGVNALSFGAGKALMVGNKLMGARNLGLLSKKSAFQVFKRSLGVGKSAREATKIALRIDEAAVAGSRLQGLRFAGTEMVADQAIGVGLEAQKETILRGTDFWTNFGTFMADPTMLVFAGFGLGMNLRGFKKFAKDANAQDLNTLHSTIRNAKRMRMRYGRKPLVDLEGNTISWKAFTKAYEKGNLEKLGIDPDNLYVKWGTKVREDFTRLTTPETPTPKLKKSQEKKKKSFFSFRKKSSEKTKNLSDEKELKDSDDAPKEKETSSQKSQKKNRPEFSIPHKYAYGWVNPKNIRHKVSAKRALTQSEKSLRITIKEIEDLSRVSLKGGVSRLLRKPLNKLNRKWANWSPQSRAEALWIVDRAIKKLEKRKQVFDARPKNKAYRDYVEENLKDLTVLKREIEESILGSFPNTKIAQKFARSRKIDYESYEALESLSKENKEVLQKLTNQVLRIEKEKIPGIDNTLRAQLMAQGVSESKIKKLDAFIKKGNTQDAKNALYDPDIPKDGILFDFSESLGKQVEQKNIEINTKKIADLEENLVLHKEKSKRWKKIQKEINELKDSDGNPKSDGPLRKEDHPTIREIEKLKKRLEGEKKEKSESGKSADEKEPIIDLESFDAHAKFNYADMIQQAKEGKYDYGKIFAEDWRYIDEILGTISADGGLRSVYLNGDAGFGKTTLVEITARFMADPVKTIKFINKECPNPELKNRLLAHLKELEGYEMIRIEGAMFKDTIYKGSGAAVVNNLLEQLNITKGASNSDQGGKPKKVILFIDEIHTFLANNEPGAEALKNALNAGDIRIVGATTPKDMIGIKVNDALEKRFVSIDYQVSSEKKQGISESLKQGALAKGAKFDPADKNLESDILDFVTKELPGTREINNFLAKIIQKSKRSARDIVNRSDFEDQKRLFEEEKAQKLRIAEEQGGPKLTLE